jgi:hypothetical protein
LRLLKNKSAVGTTRIVEVRGSHRRMENIT